MPSSISKSKFEASQSASVSLSPGFGLSLQTKVVMEICLELGYGVVVRATAKLSLINH